MALSIVLEGPEGVGKTTSANFLYQIFQRYKLTTLYNREPGGTKFGDKIRWEILLNDEFKDIDPKTQVLVFSAGRNELMEKLTKPFLREYPGGIVIQDRCYPSTYIYQQSDGADINYIRDIQKPFLWFPDLFVFYDLPPEESLIRVIAAEKQRETNWRDRASMDDYTVNRLNYLKIYKEERHRSLLLDGYKKPWENIKDIIMAIEIIGLRSKEGIPILDKESLSRLNIFLSQENLLEKLWREMKLPVIGDEEYLAGELIRKQLGFPSQEELHKKMHETWSELGLTSRYGKEIFHG